MRKWRPPELCFYTFNCSRNFFFFFLARFHLLRCFVGRRSCQIALAFAQRLKFKTGGLQLRLWVGRDKFASDIDALAHPHQQQQVLAQLGNASLRMSRNSTNNTISVVNANIWTLNRSTSPPVIVTMESLGGFTGVPSAATAPGGGLACPDPAQRAAREPRPAKPSSAMTCGVNVNRSPVRKKTNSRPNETSTVHNPI